MLRTAFIQMLAIVLFGTTAFAQPVSNQWDEKIFNGRTTYSLVQTPTEVVIHADAKGSASWLMHRVSVDLRKTPCLTWKWRVDQFPGNGDETQKSNDDFAARIYVFGFSTQPGGLVYVWSRAQPVGKSWSSPYSSNTNYVVETGPAHGTALVSETRNIAEDFKAAHGERLTLITAIGVMADADDTKSEAKSQISEPVWSDCKLVS